MFNALRILIGAIRIKKKAACDLMRFVSKANMQKLRTVGVRHTLGRVCVCFLSAEQGGCGHLVAAGFDN